MARLCAIPATQVGKPLQAYRHLYTSHRPLSHFAVSGASLALLLPSADKGVLISLICFTSAEVGDAFGVLLAKALGDAGFFFAALLLLLALFFPDLSVVDWVLGELSWWTLFGWIVMYCPQGHWNTLLAKWGTITLRSHFGHCTINVWRFC